MFIYLNVWMMKFYICTTQKQNDTDDVYIKKKTKVTETGKKNRRKQDIFFATFIFHKKKILRLINHHQV
jgi:hypothetical protein